MTAGVCVWLILLKKGACCEPNGLVADPLDVSAGGFSLGGSSLSGDRYSFVHSA